MLGKQSNFIFSNFDWIIINQKYFQICGKILSDKYKLKYHLKVHSDKKNFQCSHCSIEFKAKENLMKHIVKFHPEKFLQRDSTCSKPK